MTTYPQTQGGRLLRRGDSFDPECHRTTHRLQVAASLLASQGVSAVWPEHSTDCKRHPSYLSNVVHNYRQRVVCTCGRDVGRPVWPEWATGDLFDTAYRLADMIQTERGGWNRAEAARAKREAQRHAEAITGMSREAWNAAIGEACA